MLWIRNDFLRIRIRIFDEKLPILSELPESGMIFSGSDSGSGKKNFGSDRIRICSTGDKRTNLVCRQLHVLDETFVMNACKEDCCYVALDWAEDVRIAKRKGAENTLARDYVLPGTINHR
jgi:hypothetical protein